MLGDFGVAGRMEHVVTDGELGRERHGHTSTMDPERHCCEKYIRTQKVTSGSFSGGDLKERGNEPRLTYRIATG
jgi:hypothetical protein